MGGLESKLFDVLPDEAWVYPGHGKDTTLGTERPRVARARLVAPRGVGAIAYGANAIVTVRVADSSVTEDSPAPVHDQSS